MADTQPAARSYIRFEVGDCRFCAPAEDVESIVEIERVYTFPLAPKGVAGVFLFRGRAAALCELSAVLDIARGSRAQGKALAIVTSLAPGLIAFRVDRVTDVGSLLRQAASRDVGERPLLKWMDGYEVQGEAIAILTTFDKLLELFTLGDAPVFAELVHRHAQQTRASPVAAASLGAGAPMTGTPATPAETAVAPGEAQAAASAIGIEPAQTAGSSGPATQESGPAGPGREERFPQPDPIEGGALAPAGGAAEPATAAREGADRGEISSARTESAPPLAQDAVTDDGERETAASEAHESGSDFARRAVHDAGRERPARRRWGVPATMGALLVAAIASTLFFVLDGGAGGDRNAPQADATHPGKLAREAQRDPAGATATVQPAPAKAATPVPAAPAEVGNDLPAPNAAGTGRAVAEFIGRDYEVRVERGNAAAAGRTPVAADELVHVVVEGDTLWHIARVTLGDPFRYPELAQSNSIRNADLIHPGDIVRIRRRR